VGRSFGWNGCEEFYADENDLPSYAFLLRLMKCRLRGCVCGFAGIDEVVGSRIFWKRAATPGNQVRTDTRHQSEHLGISLQSQVS
jgi:hypothetical protein